MLAEVYGDNGPVEMMEKSTNLSATPQPQQRQHSMISGFLAALID